MMTSKFVGYFLEEVSDWQKKLSTADSVITIWFEVQRTWSHLESIFIGSEDIRAQLPEHSKQFDTIDTDFKVPAYMNNRMHRAVKSMEKVLICSLSDSLPDYSHVILPSIGTGCRGSGHTQRGEGYQSPTAL